jgi:hypothetical protein
MRIQEWNSKKILTVLQKVLILLQKKTGEKYKIIPVPDTYRNVWGVFIGYWVVSSKKKVFRFNIKLATADQANFVSVDRFKNGITDVKPLITLSLEGFGIGKIFYSLVDFMKVLNAADALKQEGEDCEDKRVREAKWTPQPDKTAAGKSNLTGLTANFIGENPSWIPQLSSGNFDTTKLVKDLKAYLVAHNFNITGYGPPRLLTSVQRAISVFDDFGGKSAAVNVPVAKTYKGQPEAPVAVAPPPPVAAAFQDIITALQTRDDPQTVIENFKIDIRNMLTVADYPFRGVCAFDEVGGTGKTYHANSVIRELGLTEGIGFRKFGGKVAKDGVMVQGVIYNTRNIPLVIFDDCDDIFSAADRRNIMKQAMQDDGQGKVFITDTKITDEETQDKILPGAYEVDSHYVFLTNKNPADYESALKRRIAIHDFNFTNEGMASIIRSSFNRVAPDFDIPDQKKEELLQILLATVGQQGGLKKLVYGTFKKILIYAALAEEQGIDFRKAVIAGIRKFA